MNIVTGKQLFSLRFSYYILITNILLLALTIYFNGVYNPLTSRGPTLESEGTGYTPRDRAGFQTYITPEDDIIQQMASQISSIEDAYAIATEWVYVSDRKLNGTDDQWSTPHEFIMASPVQSNNPVPGMVAGDCEEQANTLATLMRAAGIPPADVRVAIGLFNVESIEKGHVWVEVFVNDRWLILDPCSGSYWDDNTGVLVRRKGLSVEYYLSHEYPVKHVTVYYNDVFYYEYGETDDNLPLQWKQDRKDIDSTMVCKDRIP